MEFDINLDDPSLEPVIRKREKRYAFQQAFLPVTAIFFLIVLPIEWLLLTLAKNHYGWEKIPYVETYYSVVLILAGLLLSSLIGAASNQFSEDKAAVGLVNRAFRTLSHGVKGNKDALRMIKILAWATFVFFEEETPTIKSGTRKLNGDFPVLRVLMQKVSEMKELSNEIKSVLFEEIQSLSITLGGIKRRRAYGILKSRYVVNGIFCFFGVFLISLSTASTDVAIVGQFVSYVFGYGLATVLIYIKHMENGIGYDPGDIPPDKCLAAWLGEIDEAEKDAKGTSKS